MVSITSKPKHILPEITDFLGGFRTLLMATVGTDGVPEASYAPFVDDEHAHFFVYISELAKHTQNVMETKQVSVLFVEDEVNTANLFARRRLTYNCTAESIDRGSEEWLVILQRFKDRFGQFVNKIEPLEDFRLFRITPFKGNYVKGFGGIYLISGDDLDQIQQVKPDGANPASSPKTGVDNNKRLSGN